MHYGFSAISMLHWQWHESAMIWMLHWPWIRKLLTFGYASWVLANIATECSQCLLQIQQKLSSRPISLYNCFPKLFEQITVHLSTHIIWSWWSQCGCQSPPFKMMVMVWYFVSDTPKVMTTLILVVLVLVFLDWHSGYHHGVIVEFWLQSQRDDCSHGHTHSCPVCLGLACLAQPDTMVKSSILLLWNLLSIS